MADCAFCVFAVRAASFTQCFHAAYTVAVLRVPCGCAWACLLENHFSGLLAARHAGPLAGMPEVKRTAVRVITTTGQPRRRRRRRVALTYLLTKRLAGQRSAARQVQGPDRGRSLRTTHHALIRMPCSLQGKALCRPTERRPSESSMRVTLCNMSRRFMRFPNGPCPLRGGGSVVCGSLPCPDPHLSECSLSSTAVAACLLSTQARILINKPPRWIIAFLSFMCMCGDRGI